VGSPLGACGLVDKMTGTVVRHAITGSQYRVLRYDVPKRVRSCVNLSVQHHVDASSFWRICYMMKRDYESIFRPRGTS